MEKEIRMEKKSRQLSVVIKMSFDEFQDLRSFMNIVSKSKEWSIFNETWSNVPIRFREMLLKEND